MGGSSPPRGRIRQRPTSIQSGGKRPAAPLARPGGGVGGPTASTPAPFGAPAREKSLSRQSFSPGLPPSKLEEVGAAPNRRGTTVSFTPDLEIFGADASFSPERLYKLARS